MNREYIIKETSENVWQIMDENGNIIRAITKDTIGKYCKKECEYSESISCDEEMINQVWWYVLDDYDLDLVDNYCPEWEKFTTWFDYVCVEYFAQELVALYKQRLLYFE